MKIWVLLVFIQISRVLSSGSSGGSGTTTTWSFPDASGHDGGHTCMMLKADITLNVTYLKTDGSLSWVQIPVPTTSHVNTSQSSCNINATVKATNEDIDVPSQIMQIDLDAPYHDSYVKFYFSKDERVHGGSTEFVMYLVTIFIEYDHDHFKDANSTSQLYQQPLDLEGDQFGVQDSVYADTKYSYFCPSSQKYHVVDDPKIPEAWITFKNFQVQAYADSTTFLKKETCPEDEVASDKVPVIVGGCLAVLVLITLIVYLVYRSRLPPSVLYLTNPNSHYEDLAFDNKGHNIEDDDEHSHSHGHGHQQANVHNHTHEHEPHVHYSNHAEHKHDNFAEVTLEDKQYRNSESSRSSPPSYD